MISSQRQAGVYLHLSSLPGPYGIGELGEHARAFVDTIRRMKLSVWQFLPLGPTAYGNSPYQPLSTFAGNELLVDIGNLVELGLLNEDEIVLLTTLPVQFVDYGTLIPIKSRLLSLAASRFRTVASIALLSDFEKFVSHKDSLWLHDYAVFRILKTCHDDKPWPEWKAAFVTRDPATLQAFEKEHSTEIESIKIVQFLFFRQWSSLRNYANDQGVQLFGDMPIYIALDSSDAWAKRDLLLVDSNGRPSSVAGVPPDYFSSDGQLWGNPLYDWDKHAANGYEWWVNRLRATAQLTDMVRIDHFRGFESYWSVPADAETARDGSWEPGPGDAIFDAIHDALGTVPIIVEDLGVITAEVDALRERHRLPGMRVLQFDLRDPGFELSDVGENRVCYTGTHDNDTTVGWFAGSPDDLRSADEIQQTQAAVLNMTNGSAETVNTDLVKAAFATNARLAIAPMQDYLGLGSEARINTPGTTHGNWRWRVLDSQITQELCNNVSSMVLASKRG